MNSITQTPFDYHNGKLGVKISYLTRDGNSHPHSLGLISYRALKKRMDSIANPLQQLRKPAKSYPALAEFESLDEEWKSTLVDIFGEPPADPFYKSYFAKQYKHDIQAYKFYSREYVEGKDNRHLDHDLVTEYTANASVLNTVGLVKDNRTHYRKMLQSPCTNIWEILSSEVNQFSEVPHKLPITADGLRKKYESYKNGGYVSLIDKRRNNSNAVKMDDNLTKLLNDLFAGQNYKPTATDVARQYSDFLNGKIEIINAETGEQYEPEIFKPISERQVRRFLSSWENRIGNHLIRSGNRQVYLGKYIPHHVTDIPKFAGSLLSIDDRQPPFFYEEGKRPWFYIGIDLASGCITAFVYGKSKASLIIDFYRQLVRNYAEWGFNLPDGLECESSLNSSFKETFLKPGAMFQNVRIEANNARGKKIERIFRTFRHERERSSPGWIGRPFAKSEANQKGPKKIIQKYNDIIEDRLTDIEDWNNEPHHSEKEMTRWEYFTKMQHPELEPTNWKDILPHLGYCTETSCMVGYVQLKGIKRMIAEDGVILSGQSLIEKLKRIEGKKLKVYWLDGNDGEVLKAVAFRGSEYICELMPIPRYNRAKNERTEQDIENRLIQTKYVETVNRFARERKQSVEKVVLLNNQKKTLNRSFVIPGITRLKPSTEPAQEAPNYGNKSINRKPSPTPVQPTWRNNYY